MKITVVFDVSPEELRAFFGLPDVRPLQEDMMAKVREGILSGTGGIDPINLMRPFLAPNVQAMEGLQRAFWQAFTQQGTAARASADDDTEGEDKKDD